jgi:hypothetical protein
VAILLFFLLIILLFGSFFQHILSLSKRRNLCGWLRFLSSFFLFFFFFFSLSVFFLFANPVFSVPFLGLDSFQCHCPDGYQGSLCQSRSCYFTRTTSLSVHEQERYGAATTAVGDFAFVAGGARDDLDLSFAAVDIYQSSLNTWTTASLRSARSFLVATSVMHYAIFAGLFVAFFLFVVFSQTTVE